MLHNILLTGASGYLGGSLLARLAAADLPPYDKLYALIRSKNQAQAVRQCSNATPLTCDVKDEAAIHETIIGNEITVVLFLIDASSSVSQTHMIKALADVKAKTGKDVHFIHTSGAKLFSSHAGAPTDRALFDDEQGLHEIHKQQKAAIPAAHPAVQANVTIIELAESLGVYAYVFVPCIVYGEGEGFGNRISIQTVAICRAAQALRRVYSVDEGRPTWPVCHITDNTNLYLSLLRGMLSGSGPPPPHGRNGYYLAASGAVTWLDLYAAVARALTKRGVVDDDTIEPATPEVLKKMAAALGCPEEMVALQLGGCCTLTARNGANVGWKPLHTHEHILEAADEEVELILGQWKD